MILYLVLCAFLLIGLTMRQSNGWMMDSYLLAAQHHYITRIEFESQSFERIPIENFGTIYAIEFDVKQNCLFTADLSSNSIKRFDLNAMEHGQFEEIGTIAGAEIVDMSYDWISEHLYFIDSNNLKIRLISTSKERKPMRRTIINTGVNSMPKGIVVHPIEGYLIYTDWNAAMPSIIRTNLDGMDSRAVIQKPQVIWPTGITIDFNSDRLYWIDAYKKYVGSCDLNGGDFKEVIKNEYIIRRPYSIAVHDNYVFWADDDRGAIYRTNIGFPQHVSTVIHTTLIVDLKSISASIQNGTNACSGAHRCAEICVGAPNGKYKCLKSDEVPFTYLDNSVDRCPARHIRCANTVCIRAHFQCDGIDTCPDGSDEPMELCARRIFKCASDGQILPITLRCDQTFDCADGSDEANCPLIECKANEYRCLNEKCIPASLVCDGSYDCPHGNDELSCSLDEILDNPVLRWIPPSIVNVTDFTYTIYTGKTAESLVSTFNTTKLEINLNHLLGCGDYFVGVATLGHLPKPIKFIRSSYDTDQHPLNVETSIGDTDNKLAIKWTRRCQYPSYYRLRLTDLITNKSRAVGVDFNPLKTGWDYNYGTAEASIYNLSISSFDEKIVMYSKLINILPTPKNLTVNNNRMEDIEFNWEPVHFDKTWFTYELVIGSEFFNRKPEANFSDIERSQFIVKTDLFHQKDANYTNYVASVFVKTIQGYTSPISNTVHFRIVECKANEYRCSNEKCIAASLVCDGRYDCPHANDELDCSLNQTLDNTVLRWNPPKIANVMGFTYTIYTRKIAEKSEPEPTRETTALEVNLNDLLACGDYVVGVATAGRLPTQRVKFIREDNDMVRFPLKVETSINVTDNTLAIKWTRECHYPSLYRLRMADLITNDRHAVDVSLNLAKISWEYNYVIAKGAIYNLSISSNDGKSIVYSKIINATPLPTPNRLTVNNNRLDDIEFNWEPIRFDESRFVYELSIASESNRIIKADTTFPWIERPQFIVKTDSFHQKDAKYTNYVAAVRVKTIQGYSSPISNAVHFSIVECNASEYRCSNEKCIAASLVCDGTYDCPHGNDELNCSLNETLENSVLRWNPPNIATVTDFTYTIYTGKTAETFAPTFNTTKLEKNLNDLLECGDYVVGVATAGGLPKPIKFIRSSYDTTRFPLNVETSINDTDSQLAIKWTRECQYPSQYQLRMTDLITNESLVENVSFNPLKKGWAWDYDCGMAEASIYNLSISSFDEKNVIYSKLINFLPAPKGLTVNNNRTSDIEFIWEPVRFHRSQFVYELVIASESNQSRNAEIVFSHTINRPPFIVKTDWFHRKHSNYTNYTASVLLKTVQGYTSPISNSVHFKIRPADDSSFFAISTDLWTLCFILLILGIICAMCKVLQLCHRPRPERAVQNDNLVLTLNLGNRTNAHENTTPPNLTQTAITITQFNHAADTLTAPKECIANKPNIISVKSLPTKDKNNYRANKNVNKH